MKYQSHLISPNSVVIITDEGIIPISKGSDKYETLRNLLLENKISEVEDFLNIGERISKTSKGKFTLVNSVIVIDGQPLPDSLSQRLVEFVDANLDTTPLENLWNNLAKNPSEHSRKMLYGFLEHNNIPITRDGCFIAYKRVSRNFKDLQTGKFDNSPGKKPEMNRDDVDPDPNNTCSRGLHVAAYKYASEIYTDGKLIECKVNPADVVAVPNDYNGEKMRVCKYEVIRECDGPRSEKLYPYDSSYADTDEVEDEVVEFEDGFEDAEYDDDDGEDVAVKSVKTPTDGEDNSEYLTSPDSRGRVGIPSAALARLGVKKHKTVYAVSLPVGSSGKVIVKTAKPAKDEVYRAYVLDKSGNIRLSPSVLKDAGIGDLPEYRIVSDASFIEVTAV